MMMMLMLIPMLTMLMLMLAIEVVRLAIYYTAPLVLFQINPKS